MLKKLKPLTSSTGLSVTIATFGLASSMDFTYNLAMESLLGKVQLMPLYVCFGPLGIQRLCNARNGQLDGVGTNLERLPLTQTDFFLSAWKRNREKKEIFPTYKFILE